MGTGPRRLVLTPQAPEPALIEEAAAVLRDGGLVAFPTETVYGLGVDATNPDAMARLNRVKGRPPEKPYSLHLASARDVVRFVPEVPPLARRLMERFWPGALTIVLPAAGGTTLGFRVPDHPVARAFCAACDVPVAAPSANRSGQPPPTTADAVVAALDGDVDAVLDGGPTPVGRESTVVAIRDGICTILREGAIPRAAVLAAIA